MEKTSSEVPVSNLTAELEGVVAVMVILFSSTETVYSSCLLGAEWCSSNSSPKSVQTLTSLSPPVIFWTTSLTSFMKTFWTNTRWFSMSVVKQWSSSPISALALKKLPLVYMEPSAALFGSSMEVDSSCMYSARM